MKKPFSSWKSRFGKGKGKKQRKQAAKHSKNRSLQIENLEPRQMLATDLATMPFHQAIDNQDVGYVEQGLNWQTYVDSAATNGSYRFHAAGSALDGNVAQWNFEDLDPTKSYQVFASWTSGSNRASNTGYRIGDDSSTLTTVRVNQQAAPNDATDGSRNYESLGVYQAGSGHLIVQLGDDANSFVIADSVCIAEVPASTTLTPIVDDGDSAYAEQGNNWLGYNDSTSNEGDFRYHTPGTGENTASFTISNLDPTKNYQLFATWSAASNRASNAAFSVLNGDSTLATVRLNQRFAPDDQIMDGRGWESLGTFQFSSATAVVKLSDNADGFVIADSIRAVEVPPTTVVTTQVDEGDASYAEQGSNWLGSNDSASNEGDFRYHTPGTGQNTATFTLSNLDPTKQYQVFATWSAASNRGSNVAFSILDNAATLNTIRLNQRFAADDQTIDGRGWESLGVYQIQSGTLVVRLSDNADGLVIADSIRIVEVPPTVVVQAVVDEGDASYAEQGSNWLGYNDSSANNQDFRYHTPGTGANTATFTINNLDPTKRYQVFATWSAASNRGSNVPFRVADGSTVVTTVQLNQRFAPDDQTIGGRGWESIGVYQFQSGTLVVQLSDNADGLVIADAIRVVEVPPVTVAPEVVDEGDSAYAEVGNNWWRGYNDSASYLGDFRYHPSGTGADAATWTFDALDPTKQYRVLATWSAASNRASNAAFSIADNASTLATIRLNQRFSPDDATIDGRAWENLGVYQFVSGRLVVKLTDDADGLVVADAIRLVEVEPSTVATTLIDEGDIGYRETGGTWLGYNDSTSLFGDFRYHVAGTGENQATWSFDNLPDGQYQVLTTWSAASNRADNAPYRIASNDGTLGDVRVNQRVAPAEVTIDGKAYKSLGSYFVYGGKLTVSLSDDANGLVIADAVRLSLIDYAPTASPITPIDVAQGTADLSVDLTALFADQDDPTGALTFSVLGNSNAALISSASIDGQTLWFTIDPRQFGSGELRIRATDPAGAYTEASLPIHVNLATGLYTRFYSGAWSSLPDFTALTPVQIGTSATIDLSQFAQQDNYAVQFSGKIAIPTTGDYTFFTNSDDGSRLWIDGQVVVDNDGLHAAQEQSGIITLSAGVHTIRVDYMQGGWDQSLSTAWEGPGFTKEAIPVSVLLHEAANTPPAMPNALTATASATAINVAWAASESDVGIAGYEVYRDGVLLTTTTRTYFRDTTTTNTPAASFAYSVVAVDVLGNRSLVTPEAVSGPVLELAGGLVARSYLGSWSALPDFNAMPADQAVVVANYSLDVAPSSEYYGLDFSGQIEVPTPGVYTFTLRSDDGARLWIDGQVVADTDGLHPTWEQSGQVTLSAGMHDIRVAYFQDVAGQELGVQWEGPDMARQDIPATALYHLADTQAPQTPELLNVAPSVHFTALAWSTSLDNWVTTGYEILRDGQVIGTTTDRSFVDSTVTPGVSYEYRIVAFDAAGNRSVAAVSAVTTPDLPSGVFWRSFTGYQGQVPDFSQMLPVAAGTTANFDLSVRPGDSDYSLEFSGQVEAYTGGDYTFFTNSDDGSRLWIDGQLVVNNDGLHATEERSGQIHLNAGMHDIRVEFIQAGGGQVLECSWQGPGSDKQAIPASVLYVANDTQAPAAPEILAIAAARAVTLSWSQPLDNRMVTAYEVLRDGQVIATVADRSFLDTTAAPGGTYSYSVVALDAAGNRSAASAAAAASTIDLPSGIYWRSFAGFQGQVPDFSQMLPLAVGTAENIDLSVRPSDSDYSLEFTGKIEALAEGDYTFFTTSDDGSRLWIDGQLVVNNDGLHGTEERSGQIHLAFGIHDIRVEFIQAGGGQVLECSWQGPGIDKQLIPAASLMVGPDSQSPDAPQAPTAEAAIHSVTLTWPQPLDNRAVNSYEILRDGQVIGVTQERSFVDASLAPGGTYSYSIIALDAAGNRSVASEATAVTTQSLPSGIVWRYFSGQWGSLPDFAAITPQTGGIGSGFDIGVRQSDVNYAIEFSGKLEILVEGDYTFFTTSDDGSRLWIDGQCVVDNDGMHGSQERSGQIHLTAGLHDIRVGYVQGGGDQSLTVAWEGPGFTRQAIAADQLYYISESEAPTAVQNLAALSLAGSVCLTWTAATDNTAVAGYDVYRNGEFVGFTRYASFRDTGATHAGGDSYTVVTRDAFENLSPASAPVVSDPLLNLPTGVVYRVFSGVWPQLPDFATFTPQNAGITSAIDLSVRPSEDYYGLEFTGRLEVPVSGDYTFHTASDDGCRVWIDGQLVIEQGLADGLGTINLTAGMHAIEVDFYQYNGPQYFTLDWQGPGFAKQALTADFLFHAVDTQAPTTPQDVAALSLAGSVCLSWNAASDDIFVTGYDVWRNGQFLGSTQTPTFRDTTANHAGGDAYTVIARDATGNLSAAAEAVVSDPLLDMSPGVVYRSFAGAWQQLPDFAAIAPTQTGQAASIDLLVRPSDANYALQFTGSLEIQNAGEYTFFSYSDDGSRVWIDGQLVVDNDGLHPAQERAGAITLAPGMHTIEVGFMQGTGEQALSLAWQGPGFEKQALPAAETLFCTGVPSELRLAAPRVAMAGRKVALDARLFGLGSGDVQGVAFYRDMNGNGLLDAGDTLLASDNTAADGFTALVSTSDWALGVNRIFAQATLGDEVRTASALIDITAAAPLTLTWAGGDGLWDASSELWRKEDGTVSPWQDGADAVFTGTAGTIKIAGPISVKTLTFPTGGFIFTPATSPAKDRLVIASDGLTLDIQDRSAPTTINVPITGGNFTNRLLKIGQGVLVLGAVNTMQCDTVIAGGSVRLGIDNALPNTQSVQLGAPEFTSGILDLAGHNLAIAGLTTGIESASHSTYWDLVTNSNDTAAELTITVATDSAYAGHFGGNLLINKYGTGKWTLSGEADDTVDAAVYDGTLALTHCFLNTAHTVAGYGNPQVEQLADPEFYVVTIGRRRNPSSAYTTLTDTISNFQQVVNVNGNWKDAVLTALQGRSVTVGDTKTTYTFGGTGKEAFKIGTVAELNKIVNAMPVRTSGGGYPKDVFGLDGEDELESQTVKLSDDTRIITIEDEYKKDWSDEDYDDHYWIVTLVTLTATNAYARETSSENPGGTSSQPNPADPTDIGEFTISRGEGSTEGDLKVYYKIEENLPPGIVAAKNGEDYDKIDTQVDSEKGPYVVIPSGYSSTTIKIIPTDDSAKEWDEVVKLTLTAVGESSPIQNSGPSAQVTILDNDKIGGMVDRNVDVVSTGEGKETLGNGTVDVSVDGGEVTLTGALKFDQFSPTYHGNDNLQPIVSVETQFLGVPDYIDAVLHFGANKSSTIRFDVPSSVQDSDTLRFVLLGPEGLEKILRSGHYDWDIEFQAYFGAIMKTRTVRGSSELLNRVNSDFGEAMFGDRWWIDGLDELVPADGWGAQASDPTRLADQGLAARPGVALIRGDGSSAWYASTPDASRAVVVDNESAGSSSSDFETTGDWSNGDGGVSLTVGSTTHAGRDQDYLAATAKTDNYGKPATNEVSAKWTLSNLQGGRLYQLFTTWVPSADAVSPTYTVGGATPVFGSQSTITVDQHFTPGEVVADAGGTQTSWRSLGWFMVGESNTSSGNVTVTLNASVGDGQHVSADAVMVVDGWTFTTPEGSFTELTYDRDPEGKPSDVFTLTDKYGTKSVFDIQGHLVQQIDRNQNQIRFDWEDPNSDQVKELTKITTQGGTEWTFAYGGNVTVTDFAGRSTVYAISSGQVQTVTWPDPQKGNSAQPVTSFVYDGPGSRLSQVTRSGTSAGDEVTKIEYDQTTKRVKKVVNPDSSGQEQRAWTLKPFLTDGLKTDDQSQEIRGPVEDFAIGSREQSSGLKEPRADYGDPLGNHWLYQTDAYGHILAQAAPVTEDDPQQNVWQWQRKKDPDNPTKLTVKYVQPAGGGGEANLGEQTTQYEYTNGNLTSVTYPDATSESWEYGPFSQLQKYTDQCARTTTYMLDSHGNVTDVTEEGDGLTRTTKYSEYTSSPNDNISAIRGGLPKTMVYAYGTSDAVTTQTQYFESGSKIGLVEQVTYAAASSDVQSAIYDYDENRNPVSVSNGLTEALLRETEYEYDALNRLYKVKESAAEDHPGSQPTTTYEYDGVGNCVSVQDPGNNTTAYSYDGMNRLQTTRTPDNAVTRNEYDAGGNLRYTTDALSNVAIYEYDARGNLVKVTQPSPFGNSSSAIHTNLGSDVYAAPETSYHYDAWGNVKSMTDPRGQTTTYQYDELSRQKTVTEPGAFVTSTTYYNDGKTKKVTQPGGRETDYVYDGLGRLQSEELPTVEGGRPKSEYLYDLRDNVIKTTVSRTGSDNQVIEAHYNLRNQADWTKSPDPGNGKFVTTTYHYTATGDLDYTEAASADGNRYAYYSYDRLGRVKSVLEVGSSGGQQTDLSPFTTYTYDVAGNQTSVTNWYSLSNSQTTTIEYDEMNRPWCVSAPAVSGGQTITITSYTLNGLVDYVISSDEGTTNYTYDDLGRLYAVEGPGIATGTPTTYHYYDQNGNERYSIEKVDATHERVVQWTYDALGRLSDTIEPSPGTGDHDARVTHNAYNSSTGFLSSITEAVSTSLARTTSYVVDNLGRTLSAAVSGFGALYSQTFDFFGNIESYTDAQGQTTSYGLDNLGRTTSATSDGKTTAFAYNAFGDLIDVTDPLAQKSTNVLDPMGRVLRSVQPNPNGGTALPVESHLDDPSSCADWTEHSGGYGGTYYTGESASAPAEWHFSDATLANRQFLVLANCGSRGAFTAWAGSNQLTWDGDDSPTAKTITDTEIDAQNADAYWQVVGVVTANANGVLTIKLAAGSGAVADGIYLLETLPQTLYAYDAMGNKVAVTDAMGHTTHYGYDAQGRTTSETDANGETTQYAYDLAGRMTSLTDPAGNTTTYQYNALGQVEQETITLGAASYTRIFEYDLAGELIRQTDRDGRIMQFGYDALGRKVSEYWYDAQNSLVNTVTTHYDVLDRVGSMADDFSSYSYQYDLKNRPVSETVQNAGTPSVVFATGYGVNLLSMVARNDSLRTGLSVTVGGTADFENFYRYDALNRLDQVMQTGQGGNAVASKYVRLNYDNANRLEQVDRYASTGTTNLVATSHYDFDGAGRLTNLAHYHTSTADALAGYSWTYDGAGRLTQQDSGWQDGQTWQSDIVDYAYDARGQLTEADYATGSLLADESYSYDENGNRTSLTIGQDTDTYGATDAYNRLHSDGTYHYAFDAEGNRTARFLDENGNGVLDPGEKNVTEYAWDNRNRLTKVTDRSAAGGAATRVVDYVYDLYNRRIGSLYDTDGDGVTEREERYVWDGNMVALDFVDPDGESLSLGGGASSAPLALSKRYLTAVDQVFAQEDVGAGANSAVLWLLPDHEGSNRDLARYDGTDTSIVTHYTIDSYGNATAEYNNAAADTRYMWGQIQYDQTTGQFYAMARWYDPKTGGWLCEDPKGFDAGDANLGRYCGNGPTSKVDPSGLEEARRAPGVRVPLEFLPGVRESISRTQPVMLMGTIPISTTRLYNASDGTLMFHVEGTTGTGRSIVLELTVDAYRQLTGDRAYLAETNMHQYLGVAEGDPAIDAILSSPLVSHVEFQKQLKKREIEKSKAQIAAYLAADMPPDNFEAICRRSEMICEGALKGTEALAACSGIYKLAVTPRLQPFGPTGRVLRPFAPVKTINTRAFLFADRAWFEDMEAWRALRDSVAKNGLQNRVIKYVEINGQKFVVEGNGRLSVAETLHKEGELIFEKVELPFRGYETPADVLEESYQIIDNNARGSH